MTPTTRRASRTTPLQRAGTLLGVLTLVAIAAPWLSPHHPREQLDLLTLASQPPSWAHPFGTDAYSRDVLSRVLHGARVSLAVSLLSVVVTLIVGTLWGALAVLAPRPIGALLRRLVEIGFAVPRLLVLLAVAGMAGPLSTTGLVLLIGLTGWYVTARQVADELDALLVRDFTVAARAQGVPAARLVWRHLLPHLVPVLATTATFGVAGAIGLEAGLSWLGLGVQPPTASWGTILRDGAGVMGSEWWLTLFPGLATIGAVFACNALGDALRDAFAPGHVPGAHLRHSGTEAHAASARAA